MKYVVLVSHGNYAQGLKDALSMLAGNRDDVFAVGLENGITADEFAVKFTKVVEEFPEEAEIIVLADIIGGSPLTTAMNTLASLGRLGKTKAIGGMNLPLALTTVLMKDTVTDEALIDAVTGEAVSAIKEFVLEVNDEEDDI